MTADLATDAHQFTLLVTEKGGAERRQTFRGDEITLGRVQGNDLVLPKGNVSKRHARILYREGRFIVADLNSTNGTYVNRRRIAQATIIREDDRVYVGDFIIRVVPTEGLDGDRISEGPPTPTGTHEAPGNAFTLKPDSADGMRTASISSWDDLTGSQEIGRPLSSAPTTTSNTPSSSRGLQDSASESSNPGQKFSDMASGHRRAVAHTVGVVITELGEPALEPDDGYKAAVQAKVESVVDQLLVGGQVPVGTSPEAVAEQAVEELLSLGPLSDLLDDSAVSSISAARFDDLTGTRDGRQQAFPPGFSMALTFELALRRLCLRHGAPIGDEQVLDRELRDGSRLSLVRGEVSPHGPLMNIRKPRKIESSLDDLVRRGAISRGMATFLAQCVAGRLNILIVGPPDEGAHIVLSALCAAASRERIVAVTDFDDVASHSESAVRLNLSHYKDEPRRLLEIASGIPQARLAVTLNSPVFAAAILEATGTGMSGLLAALQAANLSRGLVRLPADIVAERKGMTLEAASGWVLSAFDVVIEVTRLRDGRVRVLRIGEMNADGAGGIRVEEIFRFSVSRVAAGGAVEGSFVPSGHTPRVAGQLQALGMRVDSTLFVRSTGRGRS